MILSLLLVLIGLVLYFIPWPPSAAKISTVGCIMYAVGLFFAVWLYHGHLLR